MAPPKLAWGGYKNGRIPTSVLVDIGGGKLLQRDAARQLAAFAAAFAEAFRGGRLYVGPDQDTYRDYAYQERTSGKGNHHYKPGGSIHGYARSADLSGYGSVGSAKHNWLVEHAPDFGWSWAYGKELGEGWHFDYIGPITTTAGGGDVSGSTPQPKEYDMTNIVQIDVDSLRYIVTLPDEPNLTQLPAGADAADPVAGFSAIINASRTGEIAYITGRQMIFVNDWLQKAIAAEKGAIILASTEADLAPVLAKIDALDKNASDYNERLAGLIAAVPQQVRDKIIAKG